MPGAKGAVGTRKASSPCSPGLSVALTGPPLVRVTLVAVKVRTSTGSEKRTPTISVRSTPVVPLAGLTWPTVGTVVSAGRW